MKYLQLLIFNIATLLMYKQKVIKASGVASEFLGVGKHITM